MLRALTFVLAVLFVFSPANADPVQAYESTLVIPTYPLGPEDVNPRFPVYDNSVIYPYTMQDNLTTEKVDQTYRTLVLENEYLRVTCLPAIGSRIHSVFDKTTGEEMFDTNEVIKPGLIGLRGAWISGGIEWNAGPQGHTVTSYSPCDATLQTNADGSATLVMGNIEMVGRTRWTVRLTLHPGRAYLDEHIRMENPTDTPKVYYFWNNTAFPCHDGTRFIYPMTLGSDHNGTEFFTWPIYKDKDLTWLKNYDRPTSVFAYECAFDFFGAYDTVRDRGIVQVADHRVLVGKKAWTWGTSDDGLISMANLTDDDSRYIEVQSGPLETQADYGLLAPHQYIEWQEWWYPVRGLGQGFEYATKEVAIETVRDPQNPGKITLRVMATAQYPEASLHVASADTVLLEQTVSLSPLEPATIECSVSEASTPVSIRLVTKEGQTLAEYETPLAIPVKTPPELDQPEKQTATDWYQEGVLRKQQLRPTEAKTAFEEALAKDPNHSAALREWGVIALDWMQYPQAIDRLSAATAHDPNDGLAWYYLGVAHLRAGNAAEALHAAGRAIRTLGAAAIGYDLAGRAHMRLGDYGAAAEAFNLALRRDPQDARAHDHLMTALYAAGEIDAAKAIAIDRMKNDPLDLMPCVIAAHLSGNNADLAAQWLDMIGEDVFEFTEAAMAFADLRQYDLALTALAPVMSDNALGAKPIVYYLAAYYASCNGDSTLASSYLEKARAIDGDYAFPSRPEALEPLLFANASGQNDARAFNMIGNLYASAYRLDDAVHAWTRAADLDSSLSVAHRNLALHAWKKDANKSAAVEHYRAAIAARPSDQTLYRDCATILNDDGKRADAIALLESMPAEGRKRPDTVMLLAEFYNADNRPADALKTLEGIAFSNWEGNTRSHGIFVTAHLALGNAALETGDAAEARSHFAEALTYPRSLGVGMPAEPQQAEPYYGLGKACLAMGDKAAARDAFSKGAAGIDGSASQKDYKAKCAAELEQLGPA